MEHAKQNQILNETLRGMTDAAGDLVLETNPFKGGGVLTVEVVACRAVTASTVASIELHGPSIEAGLRTLTLTNALSWYKTRGPVRVPSDWSVRVTFSAGGNNLLCEASVYGHLAYPDE